MRRLRRVLVALLVLVVIALVAGYWYERPLLRTGTGYAAHNVCAVERVAGRTDPADDLPLNPLVPYPEHEPRRRRVHLLGLLARHLAWYAEGFGCTLADERPDLGTATPVEPGANPFTDLATPTMSPEVEAAVAAAFGDDLSAADRRQLGTRAVLVVQDGRLVAERYADGFDATTPQLGWSMTKSVTNLLVGRLVQQGKVALDDDHLHPEWTDERADITVEDLLRMTSGLAWDETYDLGTPITQMLYAEPDMGGYVASQEAAHAHGELPGDSSGSTTLAVRPHRATLARRCRRVPAARRPGHPGQHDHDLRLGRQLGRRGRGTGLRAPGRRVERRSAPARRMECSTRR